MFQTSGDKCDVVFWSDRWSDRVGRGRGQGGDVGKKVAVTRSFRAASCCGLVEPLLATGAMSPIALQ